MANALLGRSTTGDRFHVVQLLPAPATVLALAVAADHGLGAAPLAVVAVVGAVATVASSLLPSLLPAARRRAMPAPSETDRHREHDQEH
jgi:hypothetical protein